MNLVKSSTAITHTFLAAAIKAPSRSYAFKSDLKIKWVRPEKIPCVRPEKSGDLMPMPEIEKSQPQLRFRNCKELESANDLVKKLFSLEFAPRYVSTSVFVDETFSTVKRHPLDAGSKEAEIARWTALIRAMQDEIEQAPRNKKLKVKLKELIDKRKKNLKYLRRWDYKRFEWLIDKLDIVYKAPPNEFHWITRKDSLRKLTQKYCDDIKTKRLMEYRQQLEAEQPVFLEEKIRTLEFIRKEQAECGVELTVTLEEIDEIKKQLQDLLEKRARETKVEEE